MKTTAANDLIKDLQKLFQKKGFVKKEIIEQLQAIRNYALEEEDPTLTKVLRLTYEHIEGTGGFNVPIPQDESIEETEEEELEEDVEKEKEVINCTPEEQKESFEYLLLLALDREKQSNIQDLYEYRDILKEL